MTDELRELEMECQRAADAVLALNWGNAAPRVRAAVSEMRSGSKLFTSSMAWLLKESAKLPFQVEPARKLHDLVTAISNLRAKQSQLEYFPLPEKECGAA